jgi:hypothetical protein
VNLERITITLSPPYAIECLSVRERTYDSDDKDGLHVETIARF